MRKECTCGSGEWPQAIYDARNIFVTYVCSECRTEKLRGYRPEIFTNPGYWHDEPIDQD
jgi:hypothetical protein